MSPIYFCAYGVKAQVSSVEFDRFGLLIHRLTIAILDPYHNRKKLQALMPQYSYLANEQRATTFARHFKNWFLGNNFAHGISTYNLSLNTSFAIGSDPIKLAARLHGQSGLHCFVEGINRHWLANIIHLGCETGIYRAAMGWESVIALLESDGAEPVVLADSSSNTFPNARAGAYVSKEAEWDAHSDEDKWELAIKGIRRYGRLELTPQAWEYFDFGQGLTAFDILSKDNQSLLTL